MNLLLPCFMRVSFAKRPGRAFALWLPVFLLWPLWCVALLLFFLAALLATVFTGTRNFASALHATRDLHQLVSGLRGAQCEIEGGGKQLSFSFV